MTSKYALQTVPASEMRTLMNQNQVFSWQWYKESHWHIVKAVISCWIKYPNWIWWGREAGRLNQTPQWPTTLTTITYVPSTFPALIPTTCVPVWNWNRLCVHGQLHLHDPAGFTPRSIIAHDGHRKKRTTNWWMNFWPLNLRLKEHASKEKKAHKLRKGFALVQFQHAQTIGFVFARLQRQGPCELWERTKVMSRTSGFLCYYYLKDATVVSRWVRR